jgi:hypothetical protein
MRCGVTVLIWLYNSLKWYIILLLQLLWYLLLSPLNYVIEIILRAGEL